MRGVTACPARWLFGQTFLLTRLMRGVTLWSNKNSTSVLFLLTRLMRGVTALGFRNFVHVFISTHTPHARRDQDADGCTRSDCDFYSHASCEA